MLVATCPNSNNFTRFGVIRIYDTETAAAIGPITSSFQLFDEVQTLRELQGLFINPTGKVYATIKAKIAGTM